MCRTERFNKGIIKELSKAIPIIPSDILSYAQGQKILDKLGLNNMPIEYVKSSPYLLSFMDNYELKKKIVNKIRHTNTLQLGQTDMLLLSEKKINNYKRIDTNNAKLKYLHKIVFGENHEKKSHLLLWVPTSHPYYHAGGIFETEEAKSFSKIIIFSSWEMVPRMVSCMMSYYAELYTIGEIKKLYGKENSKINAIRYIPRRRANDKPKDRYGENRLRANSLLEYPCRTLADLYVPKEQYGSKLSTLRQKISVRIQKILANSPQLATLPKQKRGNANNILAVMKILDGIDSLDNNQQLYIPTNAIDVMTDIAIASPAICAYRQSHDTEDATLAAKAIVSIFNKAESAAIIDLLYNKKNNDEDYYESVLDYCVKGNLQAVLDEYAHILNSNKIGKHLNEAIVGTSNLKVDTNESLGIEERKLHMRTHFAIPFIDKTVTDKSVARTTNIRKAFNSPFRPFILSSTSIGQEGLDFHWYARKIVHWNLPSNPVDLEQREGRINRYKCLAIRRNIAKLFGNEFEWEKMFEKGSLRLKGQDSDMVPYWCLPIDKLTKEEKDSLEYIERIVPLYPLSRDQYKYERLIKVLSLYRMTLGQPRQEELLDLLKDMNLKETQLKELTIDLCPFNKKQEGERES